MDEERIAALLERIADATDKAASGIDKLVAAVPKPASRVQKIIELSALIAGILSIIGVVEIIRNWILGG